MQPESPTTAPPPNPFPGLRPFEPHEYHLFFGRDGQSDELLRRLRRKRFVAVLGTSGSGKSSLVRAGLLPSLHGGLMVTAGSRWRVTIFRPGANPVGHLADALNREDVLGTPGRDPEISRAIIEATLRRGALGLVEAVRQAHLPAGENLLVVVDQFEEIFRFKRTAAGQTADDAAAFVKLLLEATAHRDLPVYVIITMRSDFLGDCAQFRDLPEAINDGQYLIPRMTRDQRREAISGPVAVGGAGVTPRLVNRLLNDVGDNPDQLPILQHALMRTWQQWAHESCREGPLDLEHYTATGGMAEALSRHADKAYNELPDERSKTIAEKLFKLLTERGGDNRETRRPTRLDEICPVAEATEDEVVAVIDRFRRAGRSFLMPPAGGALDSDTLVDISHESLIRGWQRLRGWVDEEAQSARTFRRLAETAALHAEGKASLWRDPDLAITLRWRDDNRPNAAWGARYSPDFDAAMEFLEASQRERDEERNERARQRRAKLRLTQAFAAVLLVAFLLSLGLSAYAWRARAAAEKERVKAEASAVRATNAEQEMRREKERAERGEAGARQARDEAQRMAERAERSADEARSALAAAERAEAAALASAAQARREKLAADAARLREESAKQQAEQNARLAERSASLAAESARHANNLAEHLSEQQLLTSRKILFMADRGITRSAGEERAFWHALKADALHNLSDNEDYIREAIRELDETVRLNPGSPDYFASRSYMHILAKEPAKAVEDARKALELSPGNASARANLILGLSSLGRYDEATQALRESLSTLNHTGFGQYAVAKVAPRIREVTEQKILLAEDDEALTAFSYQRAVLAAAAGADFQSALGEVDAARRGPRNAYLLALNWAWLQQELNQNDYGVLAGQAALWARAGFPAEAEAAYAQFLAAHEKGRDPRYEKLAGWVRRAAPERSAAPRADDNAARARALLMEAMQAVRHGRGDALERLNEAVAADPDNLNTRMKRAWYSYWAQDYDGARAQFDEVLKRAPRNVHARLYRGLAGMLSSAAAARDEIRNDIREAHKLDPAVVPSTDELRQYGVRLTDLLAEKDADEAINFLERVARHNVPSPEPYFLMAKLLNDKGRHEEALARIKVAMELGGERYEYYQQRTRAAAGLREAARAGGASGASGASAREAATHADALRHSEDGDISLKFRNTDAALDAYSKSLKVFDRLAGEGGLEGVRCEVQALLAKISNAAAGQLTEAETAEYLQAMYGDLKYVAGPLKQEIARLSAARR